jgi:CubicO group peptidase (beta-lactamase class C family)
MPPFSRWSVRDDLGVPHPVIRLLDQLAADGREPGAAVCLVRDGQVEVDHQVGTRDGVTPWTPDTLVMTYSVAKPFAALTLLSAVADGHLGLDQLVVELWPEYAAHGKGATTVRQVLCHQAGLPSFPLEAAGLEFDDTAGLTALLAAATPEHEPGTAVAEHALTYGHLLERLLRAATGEDLPTRFARIAAEHGWELHLRVPDADLGRVADVVPVAADWPAAYLDDPRWAPALSRPPGLLDAAVLNTDRWRRTSFGAIGLHATARSLATFYDDLLRPEGAVATLLGPELHRAYVGAQATGVDLVLDRQVSWTLGFQIDEESLAMGGAGGCVGWWSFRGGFGAAYVTRGLGGEGVDEVWDLLEES